RSRSPSRAPPSWPSGCCGCWPTRPTRPRCAARAGPWCCSASCPAAPTCPSCWSGSQPRASSASSVPPSRGLEPYARIILAHELTHAVTDQHYDLTKADRLAAAGGHEDELAAYSGLVEGDAPLLMQRYLAERLPPREQADAAVAVARDVTPMRDAAPAAVRESMLLPYQEGLRFVQALYQRGGWAAVDRVYRDPPTTTEQLLHPEPYLRPHDPPPPAAAAWAAAGAGPPTPASASSTPACCCRVGRARPGPPRPPRAGTAA